MSTSEFWRGRRVFLTGHTGFKGAWLALWLARMGARVTGYALPAPTSPSLYELAGIERHLEQSIVGDINDATRLAGALAAAEPEIVFHLAAQPLVRESYRQPAATFATNVMGTVNLLEAVRATPSVRAALVVTTDKCYLNREWVWGYRETDPLGGHDPYSASKAAAEIVAASYRASFFETGADVALVTARAGNVIGGGDFAPDRLLPDVVRAIEHNATLEIRYPDAVRPWQYVLEPLRGYLDLAQRAYAREAGIADAWNFGPSETGARTVRDVVQRFVDVCAEQRPAVVQFGATQPQKHEANLLRLDISKARAQLGWHPCLGFDETLALTADWYRAWLAKDDLKVFTERQLERYLDTVSNFSI
ncbi:CDP-glucose 4,6-dehydratase [Paraburkholderia bannensis]|uniref:CDP-glucose 4,6-dehydratase n=1 Tax=Paraburkholderia bannensis TaxID=765414 RepID=UPI002AB5FAB0|nr:CDP-glucose 4,6-dehydratase [Paraburkholderia bannensis]